MSFTHLHVHTQYSFLQSMVRMKDLVKRAQALQMNAIGMCDTNNIFGAIDFYFSAKDAGIKPILGCELFYVPQGRFGVFDPPGKPIQQLVVLCKNRTGYQNLSKLLSRAYSDGAQNKSNLSDLVRGITDQELLDKYGEGLIVLGGSLRGPVGSAILQAREEEAMAQIQWFRKRFGEDFYLEIVDSGLPEQESVNSRIYEIAQRNSIPIVGTSEVYYLEEKDAEAQEVLQCIPLGRQLDFERPKSMVPPEFYLKSSDVMKSRLEAYPGAYEATAEIAAKCDLSFKFKDEQGRSIYHLPNFRPEGVAKGDSFDVIEFFRTEARNGLKIRFTEPEFAGPEGKRKLPNWEALEKEYWERLESELSMIEKTGFSGYFLIVSDFIKWAKKNDIPVGPGRGSGAGSLVAYSLQITDIDPIEFKLLFERFINPERVSMPDFDIDFCQDRRGKVIEYVEQKYGKENVAQIITFGKLQARAVIKDVGRVMGLSFAETNLLTKLLPDELNLRLTDAFEKTKDLQDRIAADPKLAKIWDYSVALEGLYRNAGIHAAGVIITEEPIVSYCPLYVTKDGDSVTQFDKDFAEKIGLVKFDFLGLKTLTVIDKAAAFIRQDPNHRDFDLKKISMRDEAVFRFISSGRTDGVFQIESSGMKDLCRRIIPNNLEDLTAIGALFRPGPLGSGMVDDFIERKHGRRKTEYDLPQLEPILRDTFGVIVYQEQVMQIARDVAGYSLGQADMLRRAMGKKKPEEMAKHKEIFVKGATEKGVQAAKAEALFDLLAKFAEYGFNKSHSAAYGWITYQTAYLKTHHTAEFMAALMATEMSDTEKLAQYTADARAMDVPVLPPDVNVSDRSFTVETLQLESGRNVKAVRFGLEAIKGVGGAAVDVILEARNNGGKFKSVLDFVSRVQMRKVNKKVLESLSLSGALDSIAEVNRPSLISSIEKLIDYGTVQQEQAELGQGGLFADFKPEELKMSTPVDQVFKVEPDFPLAKKLLGEKQVVGFFMSGHPMDPWQQTCKDWLGFSVADLKKLDKKREVRFAGIVGEMKELITKKGSRMAFLQVEDLEERIEVIAFPEFYTANMEILKAASDQAEPLVFTGNFELREGRAQIIAEGLERLEAAHKGRTLGLMIEINVEEATVDQIRALKGLLLERRGKAPVSVSFKNGFFRARMDLPKNLRVEGSPQTAALVNKIFGKPVAALK